MTLYEAIDVVLADRATASPQAALGRSRRRGLYVKHRTLNLRQHARSRQGLATKPVKLPASARSSAAGYALKHPIFVCRTYKLPGLASTFSG
jgi:hypothetical protein